MPDISRKEIEMHTRFKHKNAMPLLALMGLYAVSCSPSQAQENALELETMGHVRHPMNF